MVENAQSEATVTTSELEKTLSREQKKMKKLEERFTLLAKEKRSLEQQLKKNEGSEKLINAHEQVIAEYEAEDKKLEEMFTMMFNSKDFRKPKGGFDTNKISQMFFDYSISQQASGCVDDQLINVMKEESENLKSKVIQLTEKLNRTGKDQQKVIQNLEMKHREKILEYQSQLDLMKTF